MTTIPDDLLNQVVCMDALALMRTLPDGAVDAIIADPPYNTTKLEWEQVIDWPEFWVQARRVLKSKMSPAILFSAQPFTTDLIMSNRKGFRYEIIWQKTMPVGFLDANRRPLRCHENILVFADGMPEYTPQMEVTTELKHTAERGQSVHYGVHGAKTYVDDGSRYPRSVWAFAQRNTSFKNTKTNHPTEKPVALMTRLVLTYTAAGEIILDPFCGSGSTLVAALQTNRRFIGGDTDAGYVGVARTRLADDFTLPMFDTLPTAESVGS